MEGVSEGEKIKPAEGGETKSKRKMKTAAQLEVLEKTYAEEAYPPEATRAELSVKLGLSDRQLQMWFCHRRLKDRKPTPPTKRHRKNSPAAATNADGLTGVDVGNEHMPLGHEVDPRRAVLKHDVAVPRMGSDLLATRRYNEPSPQLAAELRAISFVEAQLGERLREKGPILGMEFDPLPPGAFGAPIETPACHKQSGQVFETGLHERPNAKPVKDSVRTIREYQFLPEQPTVRAEQYERVSPLHHYGLPAGAPFTRASTMSAGRSLSHLDEHTPYGHDYKTQIPNLNLSSHQDMHSYSFPSTSGDYETARQKNFTNTSMDANFGAHPIHAVENPFVSSERKVVDDEDVLRIERKRKSEEVRIAREVEAQEKRIRKELEKQDILRRKREEQIRKEMERQDRERRKEEERLLREKQREEDRYLKEQRREMLRREKFLLKESIRAEKLRQKEEIRREKEVARLRAANERAIARKIAKEATELIEDERLELMEFAASSKGLPSMLCLDFETLQNLDVYSDKLAVFPPKTVRLKKPFSMKPWNGSAENIGNLLMVWRFLIAFADVLGIWPFTLDEFVQAFHDYDPRLLGEIHIALLRTILKDIEDVARTLSIGLGTGQNTAANPGCEQLRIIEGAYGWGFDIRSWKCHLNALTWPEILRQFSLSAGFGPRLKKQKINQAYLPDDNEANNSENIISNLRNGVAAENAFAKMQERGISNSRRSRHRLTPGTVKFAAFHVLSLEGDKGLTILEVAEKIQKSGLRDLTTSKTPEASIAAALSRDTKLFERVAPSTYCVRAPYQKDPADTEAILSDARERIKIFKSGSTNGEDVDDGERDADDVERDEDSESDLADDPEINDLAANLNPKKETLDTQNTEAATCVKTPMTNGDESSEIMKPPGSGLSSALEDMKEEGKRGGSLADRALEISAGHNGKPCLDQENACIDESKPGEPWVQGLLEGEYSDLSVEERLSALVALLGVAIEGNSIRIVLEDRLEAANALKKQMWAEVQLDKRRIKEEFVMRPNYSSYPVNKPEHNLMVPSSWDGKSPMVIADKDNGTSMEPVFSQERLIDAQNDQNYTSNIYSEGNLQLQDATGGPDSFHNQQQVCAVDRERLRAQLKSYVGCKAEELYMYRSLPLGQDRRRNRYWRFTASASLNDPGCGRIFVELRNGNWRLFDSEEGFDALLASLDVRGVRESHLHYMLQRIEISFKESVRRKTIDGATHGKTEARVKSEAVEMTPGSPSSSICGSDSDMTGISATVKIELVNDAAEKSGALKRYQDFEKWMCENMLYSATLGASKYGERKSKPMLSICQFCHDVYYFMDAHCLSCHMRSVSAQLHFSEQVVQLEERLKVDRCLILRGLASTPLRIRVLKIQLAFVEASLPPDVLQPYWAESCRKSWGLKLVSSTSAEELLQVLTMLEKAFKRDYLSSNFETTMELLPSCYNHKGVDASDPPVLPWIPKTTAAVAFRLFELDNSVAYTPKQKMDQQDKESGDFINISFNNTFGRHVNENEATETPLGAGSGQEAEQVLGFSNSGRGQPRGRGRPRSNGGKSRTRVTSLKSSSGRRVITTTTNGEGSEGLRSKAQARAAPSGHKCGRRSTRSRKRPSKTAFKISNHGQNPNETMPEQRVIVEGVDEVASSSGRSGSQYNDDDGQAIGDEYDDEAMADEYAGGSNGLPSKLMDRNDYNMNSEEEEDDEEDNDIGDMNVEGYLNEDSDSEEPRNKLEPSNVPKSFPFEDPDLTSSSSGFSD